MANAIEDIVHLTADNTNVFDGRFGATLKAWCRRVRIQVISINYDLTFSCSLFGEEMTRDSAAHIHSAADLGSIDWTKGHILKDRPSNAIDFDPLVNVNVTTGADFLVVLRQES